MSGEYFRGSSSASSLDDEGPQAAKSSGSHIPQVPKKRKYSEASNGSPESVQSMGFNQLSKKHKSKKGFDITTSNLSDDDSDDSNVDKGETQVQLRMPEKALQEPIYNNVAKNMMAKMGYREGMGLGVKNQGMKDIIETSKQRGRRGLGHQVKGFEPGAAIEWDPDNERVAVEGDIDWMPICKLNPPSLSEMREWLKFGTKKLTLNDEVDFCDPGVLKQVLSGKSVFDNLESEELRKARTKSNPFETIRGGIFQNRAAMKMAEMDANFDFMFTNPKTENDEPVLKPNDLLFFADICAGPGGFSEYILWKKKWHSKGFGLTLRSLNDFKLDEFHSGPPETFEPHYGFNGAEGDGDIFKAENLRAFRKHILENTDPEPNQGVHFVMADGGFSVEGNENIQEIMSKQLYLCQFLCALSVIRTGGHFVCKLFDLFTPFSVGLVYLLYRAFKNVCIYKPNTSRPANSERYIICKWKRDNVRDIHDYMFEANCNMESLEKEEDVVEIVPMSILREDTEFYQYIVDSNNILGQRQVIGLQKIRAFVANTDLFEMRQNDMRKQCLERWKIPDQMRSVKSKAEPANKFSELLQGESTSFLNSCPEELTETSIKKLGNIFDYRCLVSGAETTSMDRKPERCFLFGLGRYSVHKWNGKSWITLDPLMLELPAGTLIFAEIVTELKGEARAQKKMMAVHIVDVMFIGGENMSSLHFTDRMKQAAKLVKAVYKPTKAQHLPIKVKEVYKLEDIDQLFTRLEMRSIKGNQNNYRMCYRMEDGKHFIPCGMYLIKITQDPWMIAVSKTHNKMYYFNSSTREALFECPRSSISTFSATLSSLLYWSWDQGVQILDNQPAKEEKIHRKTLVEFVKSHLRKLR